MPLNIKHHSGHTSSKTPTLTHCKQADIVNIITDKTQGADLHDSNPATQKENSTRGILDIPQLPTFLYQTS